MSDWQQESKEREARISAYLDEKKITIKSVFVPWGKSRNAEEQYPSLNWRVTLLRDGRKVLTTDYSAGCAHAPSYQQRMTFDQDRLVRWECENGRAGRLLESLGVIKSIGEPLAPSLPDVLYSLLGDSEVIDYPNYEDWAGDFGFDLDSRKGEALYRACLEIALQMRAGLGEKVLGELRELYQDY